VSNDLVSLDPEDHAASILNDFDENLTEALEFTAAFTPAAFPNLIKHFDPTWIEEGLETTGTATIRRRRLPADRTVWLVLGMALLRDLPITEVAWSRSNAGRIRKEPDHFDPFRRFRA
jgi:hypothetical protein